MSMPTAWKGRIESISQEGLGVGTISAWHDGKSIRRPLFVPFTVPGDEITAEITEQKRKYSFGELKEIVTPSPLRVIPPCPHFTVCGGCNLEHVEYKEQLKQKALQVLFLLTRKGVALPKDPIVLGAKERHNYRWRAKIALEFTGGRLLAGFRKFHAHEVVPIKACFIVAQEIVQLIKLLNSTESRLGMNGRFTQELIVVVGDNKKLGLLVPLDDIEQRERKKVRDFFEDIYARNRKLIGNLFFEENHISKTSGQVQEHITYKSAGLIFSFLPETFIQSNVPTNELLVSTVIDYTLKNVSKEDAKNKTVIDLYAGLGNLSLPIAKRVKQVIAVEGHEASVLLGRINTYQNSIENTSFIHRSTEKYIQEYVKRQRGNALHGKAPIPHGETDDYPDADCVVIDPPRTGCTPDVVKGLLAMNTPRIVYVSCNPVTLATDLMMLSEKYVVSDIVGIDMFPDISHVETVVLLDRK